MNRRRLNLSRQPDPITWNSKRGSMKLTVKTDRNTLYLSADGNYQEQALHSFPLSACHFGLGHDAGSGHILTHNTFSGEAVQLFRFENEYQAIEALNNIRKS